MIYRGGIYSPHLYPAKTGQAPCNVLSSKLPSDLRLYQKAAPPYNTKYTTTCCTLDIVTGNSYDIVTVL